MIDYIVKDRFSFLDITVIALTYTAILYEKYIFAVIIFSLGWLYIWLLTKLAIMKRNHEKTKKFQPEQLRLVQTQTKP